MSVLLQVAGLRKAFGGLVAVKDLSFMVPEGAIVGLIGPNGSGKTTALNLITGEIRPDAGSVRLEGRELAGLPPFRINRERVARTFQLVRIMAGLSAVDNVSIGRMYGSDPVSPQAASAEAHVLLETVGLRGREHVPGSQLTYIDQKRVELARALATRPRLLLLDEWLAGLNPTELQIGIDLIRRIRDQGVTIIMIEHVMEAIRALCDEVNVMGSGELIAHGSVESVLKDPMVVRVYLGEEVDAAP